MLSGLPNWNSASTSCAKAMRADGVYSRVAGWITCHSSMLCETRKNVLEITAARDLVVVMRNSGTACLPGAWVQHPQIVLQNSANPTMKGEKASSLSPLREKDPSPGTHIEPDPCCIQPSGNDSTCSPPPNPLGGYLSKMLSGCCNHRRKGDRHHTLCYA